MSTLLKEALSQYGVKEIVGKDHNPAILRYAKESGLTWVTDDETPWCSIFMNWCAMRAFLPRSHKANARSWLNVGTPVEIPEVGDVVILSRGDNPEQGHVGIFICRLGDVIQVLGGNQGDRVWISGYEASRLLGYRRL